jgi:hypothetical protein
MMTLEKGFSMLVEEYLELNRVQRQELRSKVFLTGVKNITGKLFFCSLRVFNRKKEIWI